METLEIILGLAYMVAGYWATGQTIYANKIIIAAPGELTFRRIAFGIMFGVVLIPIALIKNFLKKKL